MGAHLLRLPLSIDDGVLRTNTRLYLWYIDCAPPFDEPRLNPNYSANIIDSSTRASDSPVAVGSDTRLARVPSLITASALGVN